jgi:uncharacterized membrane protein
LAGGGGFVDIIRWIPFFLHPKKSKQRTTMGMNSLTKASISIMGLFYVIAGINHFILPDFYLPLIPDYIPYPKGVNIASGMLEVLLGLGIFSNNLRNKAAIAIIVLLILFIPSHMYFIQIGGCVPNGLCVPLWIGWMRLMIIHPLLIYWAYTVSKR